MSNSDRADLIWRIANPIMAGLIGFHLANITGALVGAALAVALQFVPAALKLISLMLRHVAQSLSPRLETAWVNLLSYLPAPLARFIAGRRS